MPAAGTARPGAGRPPTAASRPRLRLRPRSACTNQETAPAALAQSLRAEFKGQLTFFDGSILVGLPFSGSAGINYHYPDLAAYVQLEFIPAGTFEMVYVNGFVYSRSQGSSWSRTRVPFDPNKDFLLPGVPALAPPETDLSAALVSTLSALGIRPPPFTPETVDGQPLLRMRVIPDSGQVSHLLGLLGPVLIVLGVPSAGGLPVLPEGVAEVKSIFDVWSSGADGFPRLTAVSVQAGGEGFEFTMFLAPMAEPAVIRPPA
ncbi:MAG: hypothetical protein U0531_08325 [Dehalococcoidia bacterium]